MSLLVKLKIKVEEPLILIGARENERKLFENLNVKTRLSNKVIGQVILFALNKKELEKSYPAITARLDENAVFWIAYPKKSSGIESDLVRDEGWVMVLNSEYTIVSSTAIDDVWTGMRIKKKSAI